MIMVIVADLHPAAKELGPIRLAQRSSMRVRRLARHHLVTATALVGVAQCRAVHAGLVSVMNVKPNTDLSLS